MKEITFLNTDTMNTGFQYLEDVSTAYWFSEVLFAAIELKLFDFIEAEFPNTDRLSKLTGTDQEGLQTLLNVLDRMELVEQIEGKWLNSLAVKKYLVSSSPSYMGNFFIYRKYMQTNWKTIIEKISLKPDYQELVSDRTTYKEKTFNYVRAMDELMKNKAVEIVELVGPDSWQPPVLDIGGGAGSLSRAFLQQKFLFEKYSSGTFLYGDLVEIPEVVEAARKIYKEDRSWEHIHIVEGDFRYVPSNVLKKYGLILLSNFLHTYSGKEAIQLIEKACTLLDTNGTILIHDYFPDRRESSPLKGPLYDLNMMLNTFNGRCHEGRDVLLWLKKTGLKNIYIRDLRTDSSVIIGK